MDDVCHMTVSISGQFLYDSKSAKDRITTYELERSILKTVKTWGVFTIPCSLLCFLTKHNEISDRVDKAFGKYILVAIAIF